jgi:Aerotolerance regulator N-terminal/von Willebrand factor type A domain
MFFLNLTAAEFLTLLGALGGLITALYLLDRAKRRKFVSTLQFWAEAGAPEQHQARRKMHEPWSLLLQLLSLLLLLLAISRVQLGKRASLGSDHVLLIDTGSWTAAPIANGSLTTVLESEKQQARRYLSALPRTDRVMLVAADSLATPLTRFTDDPRQLDATLNSLTPGFSALNVDAVLSFARQAQNWSRGGSGETVYIGPQLIQQNAGDWRALRLRVFPVKADRENCGIRQMTVQQVQDEANTWQSFVKVKNYGEHPRIVRLAMRYGGTSFSPRRLSIAAGDEVTAEYTFTIRTPGELVASIDPGGSLASDDRASLSVPLSAPLRVAVYTDRPEVLKPLLDANRQLRTVFFTPSQYSPKPAADIAILDRLAPSAPPAIPALWINPVQGHSPLPIKETVPASLITWSAGSSVESALHAKPLRVPAAETFQLFEGDEAIASIPQGPVVILRSAGLSQAKTAVIGFDPGGGDLRFEVATPLLFADLLEWLDQAAFRTLTLTAEQVGLISLHLDTAEQHDRLQILDEHGSSIPFTRRQNTLQLFVTHPTTVHVASRERERVIGLRLPAVADRVWNIPETAATGLPFTSRFVPGATDLWKWFALAGGFGLLLEWILFGRGRRVRKLRRTSRPGPSDKVGEHAPELVTK